MRKSAPQGRPSENLIAYQSNRHQCSGGTILAEDAPEQFAEFDRLLESLDLVVLDALAGDGYTSNEALEHSLIVHGLLRRRIGAALVVTT